MTGISIRLLRNPKAMTPQEFHQLPGRVNSFCDCCRIMDGNLKVADLYRAAALVRSCGMLKWMVVDYDELIEGEGADALEKQTSVVTRCKHLSMKHHIPVFLISQLRKAMDDKDRNLPTLARLYGTGAKAKHASTVIYIDRKWVRKFEGNEADATVTLLKHRDGRVGKIDARFDIAHYKYVDREEAV